MEKQRKTKTLTLTALIIAVLGLTVAFAAMSETLKVRGRSSLAKGELNVYFGSINVSETGDGKQIGEPVVNKTSITGINVEMTKPNDRVTYITTISNDSYMTNVKIDSIEKSKLCSLDSPVERCDWDNDGIVSQEDVNKVNDNFLFDIRWAEDFDYNELKVGDTLNTETQHFVIINIAYAKEIVKNDSGYLSFIESTELPKRDLSFKSLGVNINFVQAD